MRDLHPAAGQGILATEASGVSPLTEIARLDLRPLVHALADLPLELTDAAAGRLGKQNPAHLPPVARFAYHPRSWLVLVLPLLAGFLGLQLRIVGNPVLGLLLLVGAALFLVGFLVQKWRLRGCAGMSELRAQALVVANPGLSTTRRGRADARPLQRLAGLPRGDRDIWVNDQVRVHGGGAAALDLELGLYCYEDRSTDSKGSTSYSTRTIPYVFVPLPRDVRAKGGPWFRVAPKGLFRRRTDVSLSAAFDRDYVVDTVNGDANAALFVTRVLAPDVQELVLRYGRDDRLDLVHTPVGVLVRSSAFGGVLGKGGHHDTAEGMRFARGLFRSLHVLHEMLEQVDPAYKLDREAKHAVLQKVGLAASA